MKRAWIGLGSNLGAPERQVDHALRALSLLARSRLVAASSLYRSLPWGDPDQDDYVNAVAALDTRLPPRVLMEQLLRIEAEHGRDRSAQRPNGPRTLDLDLLLYGEEHYRLPDLTLPHPRLHERAFVLLPLAELAPELPIPGHGNVKSLLKPEFASLCWRLPESGASLR
ncbi:MAG: 2-amino-4-hydroxy-6-hydroxymethyldihydropteridine diphosphokinase [Xanthomonadales bacterium]|nr:2-amino-4-hydroxy-6-hydroxymethyldihydropteridine pyrophosphokinase [Xanthomonadales bacterium]MCC6593480.1 2-amino-4-hydroxy-6-hydroxymethyldihydropteridine diphosphokinase [Xanthomonadales bacterium]MCE7929895.1 2-amino-4-hydroxy-6-hydroxymethyldihydropteridine diphosphokinase [Xanthomonadales bacterium PRO6]